MASVGTPAEAGRQALTRRASSPVIAHRNPRLKSAIHHIAPQGTSLPASQAANYELTKSPQNNQQGDQAHTKQLASQPKQPASQKPREEGILAAAWDGMSSKITGLPWFIATVLAQRALHKVTQPAYHTLAQEPSLKNYVSGILLSTIETALITSTLQTLTTKLFAGEEKMPSTPQLLAKLFTRNLGYRPERTSSWPAAVRNAVIRTATKLIASNIIPG